MRFTLRHSLVATAGVAALVGGAFIAPNLAGAQAVESFTVSPTSAVPGQVVTFTATGCELETTDTPAVAIDLLENVFVPYLAVVDGTATYTWTVLGPEDIDPGSYTFTAYCYDPEDQESGFQYEETAVLDITAAPASTTTTTAAPAAAAANVTPAFTG